MKKNTEADSERPRGDIGLLLFSAFGALIVVYLLFFSKIGDQFEGQRVGVLKTDASVRRRHERSLGWEELGGDEDLFRKDIIYTPANAAAAFIEFGDNKKIQLEPDSMIQLDDVSREQMQITLFSGTVKGDVQIKPKSIFRWVPYPKLRTVSQEPIADPQGLELLGSELAERSKAYLTKHPGRMAGRNKMLPSTIPSLSLDKLEDFEITLLQPEDKPYNLRANRWLPMRWSPPPVAGDLDYELDVSKNPEFSDFLTYKTKHTELSVQFDDEGIYYWRVRTTRHHELLVSKPRRFSMTRRGGTSRSLASHLPSSTPSGFTAEIAKNANFKPVLTSEIVPNGRCRETGLPAGHYFCRISVLMGSGKPQIYRFDAK